MLVCVHALLTFSNIFCPDASLSWTSLVSARGVSCGSILTSYLDWDDDTCERSVSTSEVWVSFGFLRCDFGPKVEEKSSVVRRFMRAF